MIQRSKLTQGRLLASTIFAGSAFFASPAFAQVEPQTTATVVEETSDDDAIIITGTLIQNPNLVATAPVNSIGEGEIQLQQTNVAEELLRELPGTSPNIGSAVNNGQGGASYVDLRGLGSNRNIVLLDGNRIVPSDQVGRVNLNNIPVALVQRVDVLTGGASTTYGADAVSGVVNFITRRDFAGMQLDVSNAITEQGDGHTFRADLTLGANFDDGRGNVVLAVGYGESDPVYQGARDIGQNQVSSASGASAGGSGTAVPVRIAFFGAQPTQQLNPTNTALVPTYSTFNFNPYNLFQTPFERFSVYGAGHYEVSDDIEVYGRGLFSKTTVVSIVAPSGIFGDTLTINANNPYLPAAVRNQLCIDQPDVPVGFGAGPQTITPAECTAAATAQPGTAAYRVLTIGGVYRRTTELGPRQSDYTSNVFDSRVGAVWHIADSIDLDVSGAYGESQELQTQSGYTITNRIQQALLANTVGACQDPTGGCVPLNIFGQEGSITPLQAGFVGGSSVIQQNTTLSQARALLSGDFGWTSPWGNDPIAFAIGGEFREYTAEQIPDALSEQGLLGGAGGATTRFNGAYNVYEAFGELIVPLVQDRPFFDELVLEGGIRYSSYRVDAPGNPSYNTTTWKVAGTWAPIDSLRFRGNYQRAVRAPNISELFTPQQIALTNLTTDPCQGTAPQTSAALAAVCIAQGATAAHITNGIPAPNAGQINGVFGGNPNLLPEKATTWTVGMVFQPDFIPGLSLSIDYYDIHIDDAITAPTPRDALDACFAVTLNPANPACTIIRRNPVNGGLSGPTTGANPVRGLFLPLTNQGILDTRGIDFVANYNTEFDFAGGMGLDLGLVLNWTDQHVFDANQNDAVPGVDCVGLYSTSCGFTGSLLPEWSWTQRTTLTFGDVDVSLLWRHLSSFDYEFANDPANDAFAGTITGVGPLVGRTVDFNHIPSADYFDLTTRFAVSDELTITLGVQNLLDKEAPLVGNTIGSTTYNSGNTYPSTYDTLGRTYAISGRLRF
jgi:iron complex outermembrane recepter protein